MSSQLPPSVEVAEHYDNLLRELGGEYIHSRWGDSEIKRRHYRQTELAIQHAISRLGTIGDVLEIGCGPAVWTPLFLPRSRSVSLVDISTEMLREARLRLESLEMGAHASKVSYTYGDFIELYLEPGSFDTIVSARAFEYMSDKHAFVQKCFRLLRPGGSLVLVTKNRNWHDLRKTARSLAGVHREKIPVGTAMQLDLLGWERVVEIFRSAGLSRVSAYPVVIGSYDWSVFTTRPGLSLADFLQRLGYRYCINGLTRLLGPLMESYLVTGIKTQ